MHYRIIICLLFIHMHTFIFVIKKTCTKEECTKTKTKTKQKTHESHTTKCSRIEIKMWKKSKRISERNKNRKCTLDAPNKAILRRRKSTAIVVVRFSHRERVSKWISGFVVPVKCNSPEILMWWRVIIITWSRNMRSICCMTWWRYVAHGTQPF